MSLTVTRQRFFGRGANSAIFFFMVFWCLGLGIGAFIVIRNVLPIPENGKGGANTFSIVWLILMIIATLVFLIIALAKVRGASAARKIRKYGKDDIGGLAGGSSKVAFYSGTPVSTSKIKFIYRYGEGLFGLTEQLVSKRVYDMIERCYTDSKLPIKYLDGYAVLDNDKILRGIKPSMELFDVDEKPSSTKTITLKSELPNEDASYVNNLAIAYMQGDKKKIEELGLDRFNNLCKEYQTPKMLYIIGRQKLEAASNKQEAKVAMEYIARSIKNGFDGVALLDAAMLFDNGYKDLIAKDDFTAVICYSSVLLVNASSTACKALVRLINNDPGLINKIGGPVFNASYNNIAHYALEKSDPNACYFAYKYNDKYYEFKKEKPRKEKERYASDCKRVFLSKAKELGYKVIESLEDNKNDDVVFDEQDILRLFKAEAAILRKTYIDGVKAKESVIVEYMNAVYDLIYTSKFE